MPNADRPETFESLLSQATDEELLQLRAFLVLFAEARMEDNNAKETG